jgi:peroxiredoxin Q/BCP
MVSIMSRIKKGDKIPQFSSKDHDGNEFNIRDHLGHPLVIFFYPKDDTAGCTREACSFRDHYEDFTTAGVTVIGISRDSSESHRLFRNKYQLPFTLLTDEKNRIRSLFGISDDLFGFIPARITFIVDREGIVRHIFRSQIRTTQHVKEALKSIRKFDG